jgi:hypothetical protein
MRRDTASSNRATARLGAALDPFCDTARRIAVRPSGAAAQ